MSSRKNRGGGLKGSVASVLTLLVLAGVILGWAKVNHINSIEGVYGYFKAQSDHAWKCGAGDAKWNCDKGGSGTSGKTSGHSSSGGSTASNGSGSGSGSGSGTSGTTASGKTALVQKLDKVTVADPAKVDYNRSEWKHWIGSPCNTRETVLKTQGTNVRTDKNCKIISGTWNEPYLGKTVTNSGSLDIDHVIPLGYVAAHGGQSWSAAKKQQYANDPSLLLAVDSGENRSKGDQGPSGYMPTNKNFQCQYATYWVNTATKYNISITAADKAKLVAALQKCA